MSGALGGSTRGVGRRFVAGWLALLTLPPTVLHELLHCLAAAPVADRVALVVEPAELHAESQIWWAGEPPSWLVRGVHLVPHVGGLIVGAVAMWQWLAAGAALPQSGSGVLTVSVAALWWLQVTAPSREDLRGALGTAAVGQEGDDA